jgi:hypothetical protein
MRGRLEPSELHYCRATGTISVMTDNAAPTDSNVDTGHSGSEREFFIFHFTIDFDNEKRERELDFITSDFN